MTISIALTPEQILLSNYGRPLKEVYPVLQKEVIIGMRIIGCTAITMEFAAKIKAVDALCH